MWWVGGESGVSEGEFAVLGEMDITAEGLVYIADNIHGVHVYDAEGNQVAAIDHEDINNAADVKVGPMAISLSSVL